MNRAAIGVVLVAMTVVGLAPPAPARVAAKPGGLDQLLPPRVFGTVEDAKCLTHQGGAFGFFNGERPGRHDDFASIVRICGGYMVAHGDLTRVQDALACGPVPNGWVVCAPGDPTFGKPGSLLLFAMQLRGPVPLQLPADQTSRYSLFIDAAGDPSTITQATPQSRDLANQGTNLVYQVIFNDPGTTEVGAELLADDRRATDEFISSRARIWVHKNVVVFAVPGSEVGRLSGLRGATFHGARTMQGDAALGEQQVAPGGVHAPFPLLRYTQTLF